MFEVSRVVEGACLHGNFIGIKGGYVSRRNAPLLARCGRYIASGRRLDAGARSLSLSLSFSHTERGRDSRFEHQILIPSPNPNSTRPRGNSPRHTKRKRPRLDDDIPSPPDPPREPPKHNSKPNTPRTPPPPSIKARPSVTHLPSHILPRSGIRIPHAINDAPQRRAGRRHHRDDAPVRGEVLGPPDDGDDDGHEAEGGAVAEAEEGGCRGEEGRVGGREGTEGEVDEACEAEEGGGEE